MKQENYLQELFHLKFSVIIFCYDFFTTDYSLSNLISSNLILYNFILVSKSVFLFLRYLSFSGFDAPRWNSANEIVPILDTKVTSCKIPKANPRTYIFQRGFLVGLYSVQFIFERLNFQMWRLKKELVNELGVIILTSCFYCTS